MGSVSPLEAKAVVGEFFVALEFHEGHDAGDVLDKGSENNHSRQKQAGPGGKKTADNGCDCRSYSRGFKPVRLSKEFGKHGALV